MSSRLLLIPEDRTTDKSLDGYFRSRLNKLSRKDAAVASRMAPFLFYIKYGNIVTWEFGKQ